MYTDIRIKLGDKTCKRKKTWEEEKWRSNELRAKAVDKLLSVNDAMASWRKLVNSQFSVNPPSLSSLSLPPENSTASPPEIGNTIFPSFVLTFFRKNRN